MQNTAEGAPKLQSLPIKEDLLNTSSKKALENQVPIIGSSNIKS